MGCRLGCAVVVVVALVFAGLPAAANAGVLGAWVRPVDGAVVRAFDPPRSRFGAGHLGADLAAPRGAPVRAAGAGLVAFAGRVAGALHVVIAHAGGLRTSYSFLASVRVRRGARVAAGDPVGTAGGVGEGHDGSVVHFGLRAGNTYVDPMALFRPADLASIVHLAPTAESPRPADASSERRGLLAGIAHEAGNVGHAVVVGLDAAGHVIVAAARAGQAQVASRFPLAVATLRAGSEWLAQRDHCDPHAPPADGEGGSDHRVMVVAGIDSSMTGGKSSVSLPVSALGYQPDEVTYFSYSRTGGDYTPADTEGPIMLAARRLAGQLRALERSEPGREVDLLAHSQGGVVVETFLTMIYKRGDRSYPPLGTVVTLASPLRGDPLATAAGDIERTTSGTLGLDGAGRVARAVGAPLPIGSPALRDLGAHSDLMHRLSAAPWPDTVEVTTIGSATDVFVPGNAATLPGAHARIVVPHALNAHTGILQDPAAMRDVRAALEDKPLPCQSLVTIFAGKTFAPAIGAAEALVGSAAEAVGRVLDAQS